MLQSPLKIILIFLQRMSLGLPFRITLYWSKKKKKLSEERESEDEIPGFGSPSWFRDSAELRKIVWTGERVHHRTGQLLGQQRHRAAEAAPFSGRRQPATVRTRGQVSAWLGRPQHQEQQTPPWFWDSIELRNLVCTGENLHHRSWQLLGPAKATQLLRKVLFWAFFGQEEFQTQDICAQSL